MADSFPYPSLHPLERLHIHDGLTINADRWMLAHFYHRRRQNLHFQALYQPGIVYGLEVQVIEPPINSSLQFRDRDRQQNENRWIEIQPGMAIDLEGNPILVEPAMDRTYRIAADLPAAGTQTVYIVASFVEPEGLEIPPQQVKFPERFRFDQKTSPPTAHEVEICRIELENPLRLTLPSDVFAPQVNQIDLRYRVQAQARSQANLTLGWLSLPNETRENLGYLMRSLSALYPALSGTFAPEAIELTQLSHYTAIFTTAEALMDLEEGAVEVLKNYLQSGGTVLIETVGENLAFASWLKAIDSSLNWQTPKADHLIKTQPFVFASLPFKSEIHLRLASGIVWIMGSLTMAWGVQSSLPRSEIRTAQELGINILHYAWKRQQLMQRSIN